jgi:hypothetical protein
MNQAIDAQVLIQHFPFNVLAARHQFARGIMLTQEIEDFNA